MSRRSTDFHQATLPQLRGGLTEFTRRCQSCQTEVPADWQYCGGCADRLATPCPGCGRPAPPAGSRVCANCGWPVPATAPEAEVGG